MQLQCTTATSCHPHCAHAHTHTHSPTSASPRLSSVFFVRYLVQPVSGLGEGHGHAGAQVAAGSVAVGQAGYRAFPLQRGETHLNGFAKQQHGLGQVVAETEKRQTVRRTCACLK